MAQLWFHGWFIRVMSGWVWRWRQQQHWSLPVTVQKEMISLQQECVGTAWWAESTDETSRNCWDLFLVFSLIYWGHIQQGRCRWRWEAPGWWGTASPAQCPMALPHGHPGAQSANQDLAEEHPSLHPPTQPRELKTTPPRAFVKIVPMVTEVSKIFAMDLSESTWSTVKAK